MSTTYCEKEDAIFIYKIHSPQRGRGGGGVDKDWDSCFMLYNEHGYKDEIDSWWPIEATAKYGMIL